MSKLMIVKTVALLLGTAIVFCLLGISLHLLRGKQIASGIVSVQDIALPLGGDAEVKNIAVQNEKIYILVSSPSNDKIIVVDGTKNAQTLTITLNKGENNGR